LNNCKIINNNYVRNKYIITLSKKYILSEIFILIVMKININFFLITFLIMKMLGILLLIIFIEEILVKSDCDKSVLNC